MSDSKYDPNGLLDLAIKTMNLKNDAALARTLEVAPPVISKYRHHHMPVGDSFILKLIEIADLSPPIIRSFIGGAA